MYKRLLTASLLFGMSALAPPLHAATCGPRDGVVERLQTQYEETLKAQGLQNAQALIEIYSSEKTGSYTVLLSRADGISCILSTGTHWLEAEPVPAGIPG